MSLLPFCMFKLLLRGGKNHFVKKIVCEVFNYMAIIISVQMISFYH